MTADRIVFAGAEPGVGLLARMANRHGLIAGATGTGKTVTLQTLVEGFSRIGAPSFVADVKGDLSGLAAPGSPEGRAAQRLRELGAAPAFAAAPTLFWDVFGVQGHPLRTTISDMGPLLLSRLLGLSEVQEGVLQAVFRYCDDAGLLLIDLKDLRAALAHVGEQAKALRAEYGSMSAASVGSIQRGLLALEEQGGDVFFGEPALDLQDLMLVDGDGRGAVNVLAAERLIRTPKLYAAVLLWLLAELFERLPEAGDLDRPKLVFFFDEAHLLFSDAPAVVTEQVEQVVRLIRSKGVGVYFVTQNPLDVPERILGQLGFRVQHALRAFTPRDQKAVRTAAETFRPNPPLDVAAAITELGVGEALVSTLDADGAPTPVARLPIRPPFSRVGPLTPAERVQIIAASPLAGRYEQAIDRESAYERLVAPSSPPPPALAAGWDAPPSPRAPNWGPLATAQPARRSPWGPPSALSLAPPGSGGYGPPPVLALTPEVRPPRRRVTTPQAERAETAPTQARSGREGLVEAVTKSAFRNLAGAMGREVGQKIIRGVLGSITGR